MLECAGQLTGGYFADPGYKHVPRLHELGFPFAIVQEDGTAHLTKLSDTGGILNLQTCREQLLYEVLDPSRYLTPDVIADFTQIDLKQQQEDVVSVSGGKGDRRPLDYKVSVSVRNGFFGEGQISYAGPCCVARAELARDVLARRLKSAGYSDLRFDLLGLNWLNKEPGGYQCDPYEVRLRCAGRFEDADGADYLSREVESALSESVP